MQEKPTSRLEQPTRPLPATGSPAKKVLLVDDVKLFIQLEKTFLERKEGIEVLTASDGQAALDLVAAERPDLIFMDLYMPRLNGDDCCSSLKADPATRDIPIVIVTNSGNQDDLARCREAGCDDILTKPINRTQFMALARKFLDLQVRAEPRYTARLQVRYGGGHEQLLTDYSLNISAGGLFLVTTNLFAIDTELRVDFSLPSREHPIVCTARVAWTNDPQSPLKPGMPTGIGLQFVDLDAADADLVRHYIDSNQLSADW